MNELSEPFFIVLISLLNEGFIPDTWKMAYVLPIFKKGSKDDLGNYRPLLMTCIVGILFEHSLKSAIYDHLEMNNLFSANQYDFRPGHSCTTNLLEFMKVTSAIDGGHPFEIVYFDLGKAFDKVHRECLLDKLAAHGISGSILDWINN